MILIRLIKLWARMLEWLGNTFAALGMFCSERGNKAYGIVVEKLQIRKEETKRSGKKTVYQLLVSHDAGMTYHLGMENINLKQLIAFGKRLDDQMLRWYIMDEFGEYVNITCKIHGSIISAVDDGLGQKLISQMVKKDMEKSE